MPINEDMNNKELYKQYLDVIYSTNIHTCSDEEIEQLFARLLKCLPNQGKLYKYRSMEEDAFTYALDGLQNNYLWLAQAATLNDDFDCSVKFDPIKEIERGKNLFLGEPWHYLMHWLRANSDKKFGGTPMEQFHFKKFISCIDTTTWQLNEQKAIDELSISGMPKAMAKKYIADILEWVNKTINKCSDQLREPLSALMKFNHNNRQNIYVFSMTESYDSDAMWGLYANGNRGFCIEYNFYRAQVLPVKIKRQLCSLFKVIYVSEFQKYSFDKLDRYFFSDFQDHTLYKQINKEYLEHLLSKSEEWKNEKEWRLLLFELNDNRVYADIVSGIIIDWRVIDTENAQKLIRLAKERLWNVKVRKMDILGTQHLYVDYCA